MKNLYQFTLLLIIIIILWGCPYDSPYGIDPKALQNIDESLLGSWTNTMAKPCVTNQIKEDSIKIIFSKNTDEEYNVAITGNLNELKGYHIIKEDSIKGTAYISTVAKREFLNVYIKGKMYVAEVIKSNKGVSIFCLSEHFTALYVKSCTQLRSAITFHYKTSLMPRYDDYFVIKDLQKVN